PMGLLRTPKYLKTQKTTETVNSFGFESFSVDADVSYDAVVGVKNEKGRKWNMGVTVTDNPNVLKIPRINKKIREDRLAQIYTKRSFGLETYKTDVFKDTQVYKDRSINVKPTLSLKTLEDLDKKTVGHPVVFQFPTESVIP